MSLIMRVLRWLFCTRSSTRALNRRQLQRFVVESKNGRKVYRVNEYGEIFPEE